jgi:hypothetical protein
MAIASVVWLINKRLKRVSLLQYRKIFAAHLPAFEKSAGYFPLSHCDKASSTRKIHATIVC